jgi:hypothetical protein
LAVIELSGESLLERERTKKPLADCQRLSFLCDELLRKNFAY